ncbi:hypothetical protein PQX77_001456 [Marasmius sp. AFHP31]|nr:hypothetical protein PQX77_001456 [Marasmius sp. AFHP31]
MGPMGQAIFYLQFSNGSSSVRQPEMTPISPSSSATTASTPPSISTSLSSENNIPANSIPAALVSSRADPSTIHGDDRTPGQLYASLLSTCRLGYPLWKPSPRRTATGKEYMINIGDVGVCSDLDPFHTLFNITHGEQVPEDVDPLCDLEEDITVDNECHQELEIIVKPKGAILEQREELSVFTFSLSEKEGALLMLPRGGVSRKLQNTHRFKTRIKNYWRQWYKFAQKARDLDENQTLCLLTGIERCSTWAMAVWETKPGRSRIDPDSLKLTVDNVGGRCSWSFRPAGCWTRSALEPAQIDEEPKETVFIRGIWIDRTNGSTSTGPPPPPSPSGNEDGDGDEDPGGRGRDLGNPYNRSQRATYYSQNPLNPFCNRPSSNAFSSTKDSPSGCDHTAHSESRPLPPDVHQLNEGNTINLSAAAFDVVTHPCQLINKFALELISQIQPPSLDSGCVAFSQDEDWMDVLEDFNEEVPSGTELLRRICGKLKFVAEGGAIYTETMNTSELEHIQQSIGILEAGKSASAVVPVLFQLHEPSVPHTTEDELPDYAINAMGPFSFASPGTGSVNGSSRSVSVSDCDGGGSERSEKDNEEGHADHSRLSGHRGRPSGATPRPSLVARSHQSESQPTPTKHLPNAYSSSASPSLPDLKVNDPLQLSSTSPTSSRQPVSEDHQHPEELAHGIPDDEYRYDDYDQGSDYDSDSSENYPYTDSDDEGKTPDIEIASARFDPDVAVVDPEVNPRLITSIHGSSGSRSTSIRRKGSSATERYWSGKSGYGSFGSYGESKGSVVSHWSFGAGSGAEGRQHSFYPKELSIAPGDNASVSANVNAHGDHWRLLLGPAQIDSLNQQAMPVPPESPTFADPGDLEDSFASSSAQATTTTTNKFDINYITGFDQHPDFISIGSAVTTGKSAPGSYQNPWEPMQKAPFSKSPLGAGAKGRGRERPPSMMSAASMHSLGSSFNFSNDNTFALGLNARGGQTYRDSRKDWVFRKERSERSRDTSGRSSNTQHGRSPRRVQLGMSVPSQEHWKNFLLGKFVVIREEVGGDGVGLGHHFRSSAGGSLAESKSGMPKKSSEKEHNGENASLSSIKSSKGKAREEHMIEGLAETKLSNDIHENEGGLKPSQSESSSHSQATAVTVKPQRSSDHGSGKPPQQRLVIRKLISQPREPGDRHKTEVSTSSSTALGSPTSQTSESSTSPITPPAGGVANSPVITVSPPRSPSNSAEDPTTSMQASGSGSSSRAEPPPPPVHMLSHPLGYDPLRPAVIVHKHPKVAAFSFSRHHRSSWARESGGNPPNSSAHRSRNVIMLAQRSVQEAFARTRTETVLLTNFDKKQKEKTASGSEKEKEKGSKDDLRLKIRSEGQVNLGEDGSESPIKSSAKSKSRLPFPRSPTTKTLGTKSAPANVNEANEDDSRDGAVSESPTDNPLHRRVSSAALSVLVPSTSASSAGVDDKETDADPIFPSPKPRVADHHKAYGTVASHRNLDPLQSSQSAPRSRRSSNSNLLKRLIPWGDNSRGNSTSDSTSSPNTLVESTPSLNSANDTTRYIPPWLTIPTREQRKMQRKAEDAMRNLKMSFENVSLLSSVREVRDGDKSKVREKKERNSPRRLTGKEKEREPEEKDGDVLNAVPRESLLMLLPLWPGDTDPYSRRYFPFDMPTVPMEERMFLLVYYEVLSRDVAKNINQPTPFTPVQDKRNILLPYFNVVGRQVSYGELQRSGIRLPDQGLAVSGPMKEAYSTAPKLQGRPPSAASSSSLSLSQIPPSVGTHGRECLMGSWYSRDAGIEFDPHALIELGLCSVLEEDVAPYPLPPEMFEEEIERSLTVKLTAIGSAVVEMVWAGGLALTSFEPVDETVEAKF